MTTTTAPPEDDRLRELLASADPALGHGSQTPEHLWSRIADDIEAPASPAPAAVEEGVLPDATESPSRATKPRRSYARRHWQGGLLVAAGVATLAIAAGTVLPGLSAGGGDGGSAVAEAPAAAADGREPAMDPQGGADDAAAGRSALLEDGAAGSTATDSAGGAAAEADPTLVRSGSVIVGTDDVLAGRNSFVTQIQGMGGTLVSETVTSRGDAASASAAALKEQAAGGDYAASYPYPYPSGPGIWLTVKVPVAAYDQAMVAARATGEVVQLQQSSYDVGSQITDVRARIVVLTASLKRLEGLMDQAKGVSDVIRLEKAIAERQAELDSLRAQQRDLADQTEMSQISLTLMSPEDAKGTVDPQPQLTWWESFVQGLGQFWSWLGQALLIVSPLLVAGAVLWWVRRRRTHGGSTPQAESGAVPDGS